MASHDYISSGILLWDIRGKDISSFDDILICNRNTTFTTVFDVIMIHITQKYTNSLPAQIKVSFFPVWIPDCAVQKPARSYLIHVTGNITTHSLIQIHLDYFLASDQHGSYMKSLSCMRMIVTHACTEQRTSNIIAFDWRALHVSAIVYFSHK